MARIIVLAECRYSPHRRVVLEERLVCAHLDCEHASAQLVERLGWAIVDADELEAADAEGLAAPAAGLHFPARAQQRVPGAAA